MTDVRLLPEHVASLFKPRPALKFVEPVDTDPAKRATSRIDGLAGHFTQLLNQPDEVSYTPTESIQQRRRNEKQLKHEQNQRLLEERTKSWDPKKDLHVRGDPYSTLFVGRLSYRTTEDDLRKQFEKFGPIERVRVVKGENEQSKGYAFVVFELQRDMNVARREMQHSTIHGWRILCDVERGRTDFKFKPRSLGGGLGGRRVRTVDAPAPREYASSAPRDYGSSGPRGMKRERNGDFRDERRSGDQRPPPPRFRDRPRDDSRDRARREERDRDRAAREKERERVHTRESERDGRDKHRRDDARDDRRRGDDSHRDDRERERARRDRERRERESQRERHGRRRY